MSESSPVMVGHIRISLLIIAVIKLQDCNGATKQWKWASSWNDPSNWYPPRLPCANDRIVLKDGVIFVNKNITVKELELPLTGELVLDDAIELTLETRSLTSTGQTSSTSCQGGVSAFVGDKAKEWFNPLNWNIIENGSTSMHSNAAPFMERIPCKTDLVKFPDSEAFHIMISKDVQVGGILLAGQLQTKDSLDSFLVSAAGKRRFSFKNKATITPIQKTCQQKWGCRCGYEQLKDLICGTFTCPPTCDQRVRPHGDCCDHCGALVNTEIGQSFDLGKCQQLLRSKVANAIKGSVGLIVSPIDENRVQIILTDNSNGIHAVNAAKLITAHLKESTDGTCQGYNVQLVTEPEGPGVHGTQSGRSSKSTTAIAVVVTVVLIIAIALVAYVIWRRRSGSLPIKRQILTNELNATGFSDVELVDTAFNGAVLSMNGGSFENPIYEQMGPNGLLPDSPKFEIPVTPKVTRTNKAEEAVVDTSSFENPMYSEKNFPADFDDINDDAPVAADTGMVNPLFVTLHETEESSPPFEDISAKVSILRTDYSNQTSREDGIPSPAKLPSEDTTTDSQGKSLDDEVDGNEPDCFVYQEGIENLKGERGETEI